LKRPEGNAVNPYEPLDRAVELLVRGDFNSLWILGKAGLGKSYRTDMKLKELNADYVVFRGDISDAYLYEFLYNNNGRIIVFRDVAKLLRRLNCIDTFKALTETTGKRIISRKTYAEHEGVPDEFEFTGKIIFEINDIMKRYREDLKALFSRGLFVELVFSKEDIKKIMYQICQSKEQKRITDYIVKKADALGDNFNLRTQSMCFKLYEAAKRDNRDWKKEIDLFLSTQISEPKKLLYQAAGEKPIKRMEFVRYLMLNKGWSYATAERKIRDWLVIGEIYSNGLKKQSLLSLKPFDSKSTN